MSYKVYARKYRPKAFGDVSSQEHIVKTLKNSISLSKISHAYIFTGVRGVGKTTLARLFAKALNCAEGPTVEPCNACNSCSSINATGGSIDVVEIDGASNTGVDDVRDIIEMVQYRPVDGKYKVFIIDEVHMLSTSAFNALLKTIEEPPAHCLFIFATTEVHKIPKTILSRCQNFLFRRIPFASLLESLSDVCKKESVVISDAALAYICRLADGSMRDALSLLDQIVSYSDGNISEEDVGVAFGLADSYALDRMGIAILEGDAATALVELNSLYNKGVDIRQVATDLVEYFRNLVVALVTENSENLVMLASDDLDLVKQKAQNYDKVLLEREFNLFLKVTSDIKISFNPRYSLELAIIKGAEYRKILSLGEIKGLLDKLEHKIGSGNVVSESRSSITKEPANVRYQPEVRKPALSQSSSDKAAPDKASLDKAASDKAVPVLSAERDAKSETPLKVEPDVVESQPVVSSGAVSPGMEYDLNEIINTIDNFRLKEALAEGYLLECSGEIVKLGFKLSHEFARDKVASEKSIVIIKEAFKRLYGVDPGIKVVTVEGKAKIKNQPATTIAEANLDKKKEVDKGKLAEYAEDPVIKKVLNHFPGANLHLDDNGE